MAALLREMHADMDLIIIYFTAGKFAAVLKLLPLAGHGMRHSAVVRNNGRRRMYHFLMKPSLI
jgi:hypothetical protein